MTDLDKDRCSAPSQHTSAPSVALNNVMESVAKSLRDFGYAQVNAAMIRDVFDAWTAGKSLPHGIIGMMAKGQFEEFAEQLKALLPPTGPVNNGTTRIIFTYTGSV